MGTTVKAKGGPWGWVDAEYVNPDAWYGKRWLLLVNGVFFVVEADTFGDAIDEFVDSEYGHLVMYDDQDEEYNRAIARGWTGGNNGVPIDYDLIDGGECDEIQNRSFYVTVTVSRTYAVVVSAPTEEAADSVGWNLDHAALHQHADLVDGETEHVNVRPFGDDDYWEVKVNDRVSYGDVIYLGGEHD